MVTGLLLHIRQFRPRPAGAGPSRGLRGVTRRTPRRPDTAVRDRRPPAHRSSAQCGIGRRGRSLRTCGPRPAIHATTSGDVAGRSRRSTATTPRGKTAGPDLIDPGPARARPPSSTPHRSAAARSAYTWHTSPRVSSSPGRRVAGQHPHAAVIGPASRRVGGGLTDCPLTAASEAAGLGRARQRPRDAVDRGPILIVPDQLGRAAKQHAAAFSRGAVRVHVAHVAAGLAARQGGWVSDSSARSRGRQARLDERVAVGRGVSR